MLNKLRNVVYATMIGMCTYQIGKLVSQNETKELVNSYLIITESGEILGYNIAILDDETLFDYEN
mgnify:FL=1|tara:strand:+ start:36 stop:230 length:195 start_codon:yes stop_codon:yes gene_type:complete